MFYHTYAPPELSDIYGELGETATDKSISENVIQKRVPAGRQYGRKRSYASELSDIYGEPGETITDESIPEDVIQERVPEGRQYGRIIVI